MRTITIADEYGTPGVQVDVEETIEEAITWAEKHDLTVTEVGDNVVYVTQPIDECDGCAFSKFIVIYHVEFNRDGSLAHRYGFCSDCTDDEYRGVPQMDPKEFDAHTEHFEQMMKEMSEDDPV
jgi:hypothetical protein